jgi:hypothetical protein
MQRDPILEWQRLTEHYRQMSDEELSALAGDFADLTETAQQVLRSEFRNRGLGEPQAAHRTPEARREADEESVFQPPASNTPENSGSAFARAAIALGTRAPELVPESDHTQSEDDGTREYTWKTVLCECETSAEARQLCETLRQVGIESWIGGPRSSDYSAFESVEMPNPRVLVAADQLDRARVIAANPIPQEIADRFKSEVPEYEPPVCPKCGASDPVLEGVDPENAWKCEQCGEQWTETAASEEEEA